MTLIPCQPEAHSIPAARAPFSAATGTGSQLHRLLRVTRGFQRRSSRLRSVCMAAASPASCWSAVLGGVSELPAKYKGILLDQYGCLHDGQKPYPVAIDAVRCLAERGLKILLLSNSSRRCAGALDNIAGLGFERDWFVGVVTSGEVAHQQLLRRPTPFWQNLGRRVLHITWSSRGQVVLDDVLGLQITQQPAEADFILAHGTEALADSSGDANPKTIVQLEDLLRQCAAAGMPPMVVANPDFVTTSGNELVTMPGSLGRFYAKLGGKVTLTGKPAKIIYEAAAEMLGLAPSDVIAIADSLEHDVAGAAAAGVDSLFVGGGIHKDALGIDLEGNTAAAKTVEQLCSDYGTAVPTFTIPFLAA